MKGMIMKVGAYLFVFILVFLASCSSCSKQKHQVKVDWEHTNLDSIVDKNSEFEFEEVEEVVKIKQSIKLPRCNV